MFVCPIIGETHILDFDIGQVLCLDKLACVGLRLIGKKLTEIVYECALFCKGNNSSTASEVLHESVLSAGIIAM